MQGKLRVEESKHSQMSQSVGRLSRTMDVFCDGPGDTSRKVLTLALSVEPGVIPTSDKAQHSAIAGRLKDGLREAAEALGGLID